jgi:putative adhesin
MASYRKLGFTLLLFPAVFALAVLGGCNAGAAANGSFDRNFNVTGPIRLELSNASGDVNITGSSDGKVHVHGEVRASGFGFDNPQKRLDETVSNPPIEQRGDTIRVGADLPHFRNVSIAYTIQVPHDTEVDANVASGAQNIRDLRGPVKVHAASGTIRVDKIDRDANLATASGSVTANDVGSDVQVSSASGNVTVSNVKGDVRVKAISGVIRISHPGGRVEGNTASGEVEIQDATNDVTAHAASGRVHVQGNPGGQGYWNLKTASGGVQISVPSSANFHLSAEAVSGEIRTDIPILIEEQGKHSLRARVGNGGGRIEVHTASGEIRVTGSK